LLALITGAGHHPRTGYKLGCLLGLVNPRERLLPCTYRL